MAGLSIGLRIHHRKRTAPLTIMPIHETLKRVRKCAPHQSIIEYVYAEMGGDVTMVLKKQPRRHQLNDFKQFIAGFNAASEYTLSMRVDIF